MDLSVIIVNYNVKYFLEQCLCSVIKACNDIDAEIFVVDNNSTDGSRDYLEKKFPQVNFRWKNSNDGFAKANNSVLSETKGGHILFLNPDTILPEDCFEKSLAFFQSHADCGALGVRMIDGSGKYLKESKRSFPSTVASFYKLAGFATLFPASTSFAKYYAGHLDEKQNAEVDVLAGAFMMVSRQVLNKVKGFDEDYFMYGEDIDLCYRIQKTGYKNYYFADTTIIHFKGESTQKNSYEYLRTFYAAMKIFVTKHYTKNKLTLLFLKASVGFSKLVAFVMLLLKKTVGIKQQSNKPLQTIIIAGQERFDQMIHLIKHAAIPVIVTGRVAVDKDDKGVALSTMDNMEACIRENNIDLLIFCEGILSFKAIIDIMESLALKTDFLFHADNSSSIVGSSNKNSKGLFIAE